MTYQTPPHGDGKNKLDQLKWDVRRYGGEHEQEFWLCATSGTAVVLGDTSTLNDAQLSRLETARVQDGKGSNY